MDSKTKLFGHPIHPQLIVFPLGLWISAVILDIFYLVNQNELLPVVSFYNIAGGIIGGLAAAVFGFRDYAAIPNGTRAKRIGTLHGFGNLVVLILFSFSWIIRRNAPGFEPGTLALLASFAGLALGSLTAWLGGELVDRLGVGVDPGANLNAPNSLSGEPPAASHYEPMPVTGDDTPVDEP